MVHCNALLCSVPHVFGTCLAAVSFCGPGEVSCLLQNPLQLWQCPPPSATHVPSWRLHAVQNTIVVEVLGRGSTRS